MPLGRARVLDTRVALYVPAPFSDKAVNACETRSVEIAHCVTEGERTKSFVRSQSLFEGGEEKSGGHPEVP